jgi:hypothetical protein
VSIQNLRGSFIFSLDRGEVFGVDEHNAEHESGCWRAHDAMGSSTGTRRAGTCHTVEVSA